MPRFFCPVPLSPGARVALPADVAHHAVRVLRLRDGDALVVFNGEGGEYPAVLEVRKNQSATLLVGAHDPRECELPVRICVAQGLSAADKMDWTIEKAVELGADSIQPLGVERSVSRLSPERAQRRHAHWIQIVRTASEQCGRNRLATVLPLLDLAEWLACVAPGGLRLRLDPEAPTALARVPRPPSGHMTYVLAGPEGGLTSAEGGAADAAGFAPYSLGPRILRTETAAAAALVTLATAWLA